MVVFTCSHCGDSLKKNRVEKHYQTVCSKYSVSVTCIDCCKDFSSETFVAHTKCVSEEERYSAKGSLPRPNANKGEKKQQKWQEIIESLLESDKTMTENERSVMKLIVKYENVPRKKLKFQNFLRSCSNNRYNPNAADSVFDKIEAYSKSLQSKSEDGNENGGGTNKQETENDNPNQQEKLSKKEKKEKRKMNESELKEVDSNEIVGMEDGEKNVTENGDSHNQQEENLDTSDQKEEKLSKKERKEKKKKNKSELLAGEINEVNNADEKDCNNHTQQEEIVHTTNQNEEKLSKKERKEKRKREKSECELKEVERNENVGTENTEQDGKKKRRAKKEKENSILDADENEQPERQQEQGEVNENETTDNKVETLTTKEEGEEKLTKKERKEKRKKAKYEAELKQIESSHTLEEEGKEDEGKKRKKSKKGLEVEVENDGNESPRKNHNDAENGLDTIAEDGKSKKDKREKTIENGIVDSELMGKNKSKKKHKSDDNAAENGIANGDAPVEGKSKKKRKKGENAAEEDEPSIKKSKESDIEDESAAGKTRFNWQEVIINVLESKDSKELPLKRLQKKVLAEHEALGCGSAADVKTIAKFNKKVQKTPGVTVHKDVVRLVMEK